jgi:SIR2-like domain
MQARLPSFKRLVQDIYQELGESWEGHPAEEQGMSESSPAYDRVVRSLERRGGGNDPSSVQRIREQIRAAVRKSLTPRDVPLAAHYHILSLSRDAELRHRVVTTNFDTLFERAWKHERPTAVALKSHAGPALPSPRAANFNGVLHLHGRVGDADLSLEETDLVLTSAEFGEAYLRAGWAARYIYDLVRALTVVIIGYAAAMATAAKEYLAPNCVPKDTVPFEVPHCLRRR